MDFKIKLKIDIIPWVETMLKKERDHLAYLQRHSHVAGVSSMIESTSGMISHFEMRLAEYKSKADEKSN
jgi:hypothetical protein